VEVESFSCNLVLAFVGAVLTSDAEAAWELLLAMTMELLSAQVSSTAEAGRQTWRGWETQAWSHKAATRLRMASPSGFQLSLVSPSFQWSWSHGQYSSRAQAQDPV